MSKGNTSRRLFAKPWLGSNVTVWYNLTGQSVPLDGAQLGISGGAGDDRYKQPSQGATSNPLLEYLGI